MISPTISVEEDGLEEDWRARGARRIAFTKQHADLLIRSACTVRLLYLGFSSSRPQTTEKGR